MIIFDLTWKIFFYLVISLKNQKQIFLLSQNQHPKQNECKILILEKILKFDITVVNFNYSDLRGKSGELLTYTANKRAYEDALKFANNKNTSIPLTPDFKKIKRHLDLYLATQVYNFFYDISNKILVSESLITEKKLEIWLTAPKEIVEFCSQSNYYNKILFIKQNFTFRLLIIRVYNVLMLFLFTLNLSLKLRIKSKKNEGGILVFLDSETTASQYLRDQLFWAHGIPTNQLTLISRRFSTKKFGDLTEVNKVGNLVKLEIRGIVRNNFNETDIAIRKIKFMDLIKMSSSPLSYNSFLKFTIGYNSFYRFVDLYGFTAMVHENTTSFETKIFDAIAEGGKIQTIGIQYSNLNMRSLLMLTNCSVMFIFADNFKSIFRDTEYSLGPREFKISGYRSNVSNLQVISRGQELRTNLERGRKLKIISYFDENPNDRKWTIISHKDNELHFKSICNFILDNPDFAFIYKTQFVHKNPLSAYQKTDLTEKAIKSGRLIIPSEGFWRNTITPAEVGYASDFAIGFKFGGTACLEVALTNRRVIMISLDNPSSEYNHFVYPTNVLASSLEEALSLIKKIDLNKDLIGSWVSFIDKLCSSKKISVEEYIKELIGDS